MAGVEIKEDGKFVYSHHAKDPAYLRLCNAFDIVRIHKFSDDDDKKSYLQMCEFVMGLDKVKLQIAEDRKQSADADFDNATDWQTQLQYICLDVQNQLISDRLMILDTCKTLLDSLFQDPALMHKQKEAEMTYDKAHKELADFVEANKWQLSDQTVYQKKYTAVENTVMEAKAVFEQADTAVQERLARKNQIDLFIQNLSEHDELLLTFDETLWNVTVDEVLVKPSGELVFSLKSGQKIVSRLRNKL